MSVAENVLEMAAKAAEQAEVYMLTYEETPVAFEGNRLKSIMTRQSSGIALRIIKNGRIGFASTMGEQGWQDLVAQALETAQFGGEAHLQLPAAATYANVNAFDASVSSFPLDAMVQAGQSAIDQIVARSPEIICEAGVNKLVSTVRILNTAGCDVTFNHSSFSARLEGTLVRGDDMLFVGDRVVGCSPRADLSDIVRPTLDQLEFAKETVPAPHGNVPVIFTPRGVAQTFMPVLSLGFNGKTVLQKASPLTDRLGQACFDKAFTLTDNPLLNMQPNSRPFDDEGVPCQTLRLAEAGVLRSFLYDLQTGGSAGVPSTGSANRAVSSLPTPGFSTIIIEPGDVPYASLLADIEEGVIVEEMLGATQGNTLGGDFGGNVLLGYKVEHGRIVGRVKNTMVAGNVYAILKEIGALTKETRQVGAALNTPYLMTRQATVSTKA